MLKIRTVHLKISVFTRVSPRNAAVQGITTQICGGSGEWNKTPPRMLYLLHAGANKVPHNVRNMCLSPANNYQNHVKFSSTKHVTTGWDLNPLNYNTNKVDNGIPAIALVSLSLKGVWMISDEEKALQLHRTPIYYEERNFEMCCTLHSNKQDNSYVNNNINSSLQNALLKLRK